MFACNPQPGAIFSRRMMIYYGVASRAVEEVLEFYSTREEAESVVRTVVEQAPELEDDAFIAEIDFPTPSPN